MNRQLARDLELETILKMIAAHARTRVGRSRILGGSIPETVEEAAEQARLSLEMDALLADDGPLALAQVDDAEPWLNPAALMPTDPSGLLDLLSLARRVVGVRRRLLAAPEELIQLRGLGSTLPDLGELVAWASLRLGRDGSIPDGASPELGRLRAKVGHTRQHLLAELDAIRRSNPDVVSDAPPTLRRDRYCIPVRSGGRAQLPGLLLDSSGSGATAFIEPYGVVELNNQLADSDARIREEIRRLLAEIAAAFAAVRNELAEAVEILGALDAAQAKVLFGRRARGRVVIPEADGPLVLRAARHPLLDEVLHELRVEVFGEEEQRGQGQRVVALDFELPPGVTTLIVSGPNAGGKTVVVKTIGLMVLMAYSGVPVPLAEGSVIPWFDSVWCHIGDEQDVAADLSTFSGAMAATARLLTTAEGRTLVLYDELGAGTDPLEGSALGFALLEELTRRNALTVATTHLAAVALNATNSQGMANAAMEYDENEQRPTYALRLGRPGRSRGLEIATAMGVHRAVLDRARELLGGHHLELDRWLRRLELLETELLAERQQLAREGKQLEGTRAELALEKKRLEAEHERLMEELAAQREQLRHRAKVQLDRALAVLEEATRELRPLGKRAARRIRNEALDLESVRETPRHDGDVLAVGDVVEVSSLGSEGALQELRGSRALVVIGSKRLWVGTSELRQVDRPAVRPKVRIDTDSDGGAPFEVVLLGMDMEAAREQLERALDHAYASGRPLLRVVHGHGTGALRRVVKQLCLEHPGVSSFRHPPQHLGGTGVTEVRLEPMDRG